MNLIERQMYECLKELKEDYNVTAIKAEFEAEGSRTEELVKLNEIVFRANMDIYIKIGGCEAVRDLDECRVLGASGIMAPMIETPFAMSKFIGAINKVYNEEERNNLKFIINAETITCYENLDKILAVPGAEILDSVVVGRVDLSGSMGLSRNEINGAEVFQKTKTILEKTRENNFIAGIGGGISLEAIPFMKELGGLLQKYETRKVVFKAPDALKNAEHGILKAMEFETLYLKNKYNNYSRMAQEDVDRIKMMEKRIVEVKEILK